eukprot:5212084-Heterocapsa_arctica.AAC.1
MDTFVAGDFNVHMDGGRDGSELVLLERLNAMQDRLAVAFAQAPGATRRGRKQDAPLDGIALPASIAWRWTLQLNWHSALSDHACLSLRPTTQNGATGRACNPTAMRGISALAAADFRRRFRML